MSFGRCDTTEGVGVEDEAEREDVALPQPHGGPSASPHRGLGRTIDLQCLQHVRHVARWGFGALALGILGTRHTTTETHIR